MVTDANHPADDSVYWEIVDHVESEMEFESDHLDIEVEENFAAITGSVPGYQSYEELERLIFDTLDIENVEFDVVVDEDLQTESQKMGYDEPDEEGFAYDRGQPDVTGMNSSPRRQF